MILFWKCCFLLPIFGLPTPASPNTGGAPRIWLSDYRHKPLDKSRYQHIRPEEYNDFRYANQADSGLVKKTGPVNYTAYADKVEALVFSCESDAPVVWVALNPQFERSNTQYSRIRASIFNVTLELPLNKIFKSDFSFMVDKGRDYGETPLVATCETTTSPKRSATFYLSVISAKESQPWNASTHAGEGPLSPVDPPPETNISTRVYFGGIGTFGIDSHSYQWEERTYFSGSLQCCRGFLEKTKPVAAVFESGIVGGKWMLWPALQRWNAKLKAMEEGTLNDADGGCEFTFDIAPSIITFCKTDSVDVFQEYVTVFNENLDKSGTIYSFIPVDHAKNIGTKYKMFVRLARRPNLYQFRKPEGGANDLAGNFYTDPTARLSIHTSPLERGYGGKSWNILEEIPPPKEIAEGEITPKGEQLAEGEEVQVVCVYLTYFYADGGRLRLNWRNGSRTILPLDLNADLEFQMQNDQFSQDWNDVHHQLIGKVLKVHPDMESVDCLVPELRGVGWGVGSVDFNPVREAIPPKFVGALHPEVIEIDLNETGMGFSCEVSQFPVGDFSILRDDDMRIENWAAVSVSTDTSRASSPHFVVKKTVTIWFSIDEVYGEYRCFAENVAGSATKIVQVVPPK